MNPEALTRSPLPAEALQRLQGIATVLNLPRGKTFIHEGKFDESIYYIESGSVEVEQRGHMVGSIMAGDVVGEIAFLDRHPRSASVSTCEDTRLLHVGRPDLLRAMSDNPQLLMEFVHWIEERRRVHIAREPGENVEDFLRTASQEATSHRAVNHPYLLALRGGDFRDTRWALTDFGRQYHGYSAHFPRYLTTVIGRLELPEHRSALLENLTEESGIYEEDEIEKLREIGVQPEWVEGVPHPMLFRRFCSAVGMGDLDPDADDMEVVCWREMFLSLLSIGSPAQAVGALGFGTEAVVSTMYQHFLPAINALGADPSATVFFPLHAAVDDHHQEALLNVSRDFAKTHAGRLDLVKGMRKALALRAGFWDWMLLRARNHEV